AGERYSLVLPMVSGGEKLGALHFGSSSGRTMETNEFRTLFSRVAQLTAVAIQNARLFDQAVTLRLFNESVLESIQQGIVVLDPARRVRSANQFMQDEYGWNVTDTRTDLFDYSPQLREVLEADVDAVLQTGEPRQILSERTELRETEIVHNFYIYPLVAQQEINGAVLLVEDVTERARLEANVEERANQLAALTRASGQITSSLRQEEVVDTALDVMPEITDFDTLTLWRRDGFEMMRLVGVRGVDVSLVPPIRVNVDENKRISYIMDNRSPMTIDDLPSFMGMFPQALPGDANMESWLGVPLIYQDEVVGIISVAKHQIGFYDPAAQQAVSTFANQIAVAISNAELFEDTRARTERLSLLNRVSLALVQSMDSEDIVEIALSEMANTLKAEKARAIIFGSNSEVGRVMVDHPRSEVTPTQQIPLRQRAVFRYIIERMQPLVYSHDRTRMPEDLDLDVRDEVEQRGLKDYLLMPMVAPGHLIGAFEFETRSTELTLNAETLETGLIIANQSAIAIQNANQLEETTLRTRELETLLEAAQSTSLTMDLNEVFRTVTDLFISALDMDD
ncbi:MAG: GAF domain-containing protein, partial [Chloroflexota bacterium]